MKTLEQFKADEAAALEKRMKHHAMMLQRAEIMAAGGMPVPEYIADGRLYGAVTVTYRNPRAHTDGARSMADAVAMFAQFVHAKTVIPFHVLKDGSCTFMHPEARMPAKKQESAHPYKRDSYKTSGYAVKVNVNHSGERHHTTAELEFFALIGGELFKVSIQFGTGYIGVCPQLAPRCDVVRGYRNNVESRTYTPNAELRAHADDLVSYSYGGDTGPMKTGADHRFLFLADHDEDNPVSCDRAIEMLQTVAEKSKA